MSGDLPALDRTGLTRHGGVYISAMAVQALSGVLVLPALTRLLEPAAFGAVTTAMVVTQLVSFLAHAGLGAPIVRSYLRVDEGPPVARTLVGAGACVSAGIALVVDVTGPIWSRAFGSIAYGAELRMAVWTGCATAVLFSAQGILRASGRALAFAVTSITRAVLAPVIGLAMVSWLTPEPETYLLGVLLVSAAVSLLALAMVRAGVRGLLLRWATFRRNAGIAIPTVPHTLALQLLATGDRVVIGHAVGLAAVARYQVAYLVGSLVLLTLLAVNNAWSPLIVGAGETEVWPLLRETKRLFERLTGYAAAGIALMAPIVLQLASPREYRSESLVMVAAIVAASSTLYVGYLGATNVLVRVGHTLPLAWITPTVAVLTLALTSALVTALGLVGGAIATFCGYGLLSVLATRAARRYVPANEARRLAVKPAATTLTVCVLAGSLPTSEWGLVARSCGTLVVIGLMVADLVANRSGSVGR